MTTHMTKPTWTLILIGAAFTARGTLNLPAARAADIPQPIAYEEQLVSVPVTVDDIDKKARTMIVRAPDGQRSSVKVPEDVQGFDRLKKGDKIDLNYYRAVAVSVIPAGAVGAAARHQSDIQRASAGHPGGRQVSSSATVTSVDKQNGSVEVKDQQGKPQAIAPQDSSVKKEMQGLKPGDVVQIIYTEAVATSIEPSKSR